MAHKGSSGLLLAIFLFFIPGAAPAQTPGSRLAGDWRSSGTAAISVDLPTHPKTGKVLGAAPASMRLERLILLLEPSSERKQALDQELKDQQNPASAAYHHWLTPAAFAEAYENSASDVAAVAGWLASEGFQLAPIPAGRGWIEFGGSAGQVEQAFDTQVVLASVNGGQRAVLAGSQIAVPAALKPLVHGLVSLDGAVATAAMATPKPMATPATELTAQTSTAHAEAWTPSLLTQLLHLDALHTSGMTGAGQTIAIAARSQVRSEDVAAFRSVFGLPANPLQVVSGGAAQDSGPGVLSDREAATAAATWAGAAAPGARILLVPAATTTATDGADLSLAAIVDGALANTAGIGYSSCEAELSEAHRAFYAAVYRQAAAEGISVISATGDRGPAACHAAGSEGPVSSGYAVNALAATPWNTAAGVAAFGTDGTPALAAWSPIDPADPAYAGGGGASAFYAAPDWQESPAFQASGRRLPDLALPVAMDSGASHGLAFCLSADTANSPATGCAPMRTGGSSLSAAIFAGVAAILAQKDGPQGNLAPGLYGLRSANGVFSDVAQGNAQLPCVRSSAGCDAAGKIGFAAEAGYDLATGLGAVDAQALVTQWKSQPMASGLVSVGLTLSPTQANATYNPAAQVTLTANVLSQTGGATPTGSVQFVNGTTGLALAGSSSVNVDGSGNASLSLMLNSAFSSAGSYQLQAKYSGDGTYGALNSQPLTVTTQKSCSSLTVSPANTTPTAGTNLSVTVNFTVSTTCGPPAGAVAPSGSVTLNVNGGVLQTYTSQLTTSGGVTTASFTIPVSATSNAVQATYTGDSNYAAATSPQVTLTVQATPTVLLTPATLTPIAGSSLQLTVSVTPPTGGSAQAAGSVTVTVDGVLAGTAQLTPGSPSSSAALTITTPAAGTHALVASYSGGSNSVYSTATSPQVTITVTKGATVTTVAATPAALAAGTSETLTAALAPTNPALGTTYTLTGTVSFYDGSALLGTVAVISNTATLTGLKLANNISHSITAIYSGDASWLSSSSTTLLLAATTLPDSVVLSANVSTASPGQAVILTATVTPFAQPATGAEQNPTGTVVFYNGNAVLGQAALVATPLTDASTATLTLQTLPGGQDTLYAVYLGDLYYNQATSNLLTLTVEDFTITPSPTNPATNLTIVKGSSGSAAFVITGLGGFNDLVQVVCAVPSQDDMTCTATPQQVTPTATVTFVVQTFETGSVVSAANRRQPLWPGAAGGTALAALMFFVLPFGKRTRIFARAATRRFCVLLLLLAGLGVAGLGCNSVNGVASAGTPLGVATLKITANAYVDNTVVSRSVYLTVNVIPKQ